MLKPKAPPYDVLEWEKQPFETRLKMVCGAWALHGYGAPVTVYFAYLVKIAGYVGVWWWLCTRVNAEPGWWSQPDALLRAVLWSMLYEGLGFGCGSGPLTGRYFPPFGGVLYYLRPGTLKSPLVGGAKRTVLDILLYLAFCGAAGYALWSKDITPTHLFAVLAPLAALGLLDRTIFLATRAEHYAVALLCFALAAEPVAALKLVWVAVWWWAATSKLNRHFPSVVCVMMSNSPWVPQFFRKKMYVAFPDDLRPSRLATVLAHAGTVVEYAFPVVLLLGDGGPLTFGALITMLGFHAFITSNVPMGVPIEWNVVMVYGGFLLFGAHADVSVSTAGSIPLYAILAFALVLVPAFGNRFPQFVSFLLSMRYYAGNWAYSVWLFRGDASEKLDRHLTKSAPRVYDQLTKFYEHETIVAMLSKVVAFRAMHLHGRLLTLLVPKAVDDIDAYEWLDGELVAGVVIGWNFGDGHLHDHRLLAAVQDACGFEPGELRCIFVESQPMLDPKLSWRIWDAATGEVETGETSIDTLEARQPWGAAPNT
ncbi:MAG: DUF3556 domain-containing protein [Deltaproteobacteria bacterium]